jgi:hypothetical protein
MLGLGHQRPADGAHLLLAARGVGRLAAAARLQARKIRIDLFQRLVDRRLAVAARVGTGEQVFLDTQVAKAVPPLHHLNDAAFHQVGRRQRLDALVAQLDRALGDFTALAVQQIADRAQGRRLAGAVAAEQRHDAAFRNAEGNALEHQDHVVVDHLDAIDSEKDVGSAHGVSSKAGRPPASGRADKGLAGRVRGTYLLHSSGVRGFIFFSSAYLPRRA